MKTPQSKKKQNQQFIENEKALSLENSFQLERCSQRNQNTQHKNFKLYHLLCAPFTFINAYVKISKNKGALTKGPNKDGEIRKYFGFKDANQIATKFKNNTYLWNPSRRTLIPKPGKTTLRPIDTPTQEDCIVQEAIRGILESIYEPEFKQFEQENGHLATNYGFRPNKSIKDAVEVLKFKGQPATYAIEGDIVGAYNNVDHDILLGILKRRILDKKFLNIIRSLLKAGIIENNIQIHSLKGTPQGGIVSPLLFNIYMFEFDKFVYYEIIKKKTTTTKPKRNPEYLKLVYQIQLQKKKMNFSPLAYKRKDEKKKLQSLIKKRMSIPSTDIKSLPKKGVFSRYADDWVLFITCTSQESKEIELQISRFISEKLKMALDPEKTLRTHITSPISFLGFNIRMNSPKSTKVSLNTTARSNRVLRFKRRTTSRKVTIYPDKSQILRNLINRKFCDKQGFPIGLRSWSNLDEYHIVQKYGQILRGIANYYHFADDFQILYRVAYILQYSCAKTLAVRNKCTMPQIFKRYGKNLTITRFIKNNQDSKTHHTQFETFTELRKINSVFRPKFKHCDNFDPFKN